MLKTTNTLMYQFSEREKCLISTTLCRDWRGF